MVNVRLEGKLLSLGHHARTTLHSPVTRRVTTVEGHVIKIFCSCFALAFCAPLSNCFRYHGNIATPCVFQILSKYFCAVCVTGDYFAPRFSNVYTCSRLGQCATVKKFRSQTSVWCTKAYWNTWLLIIQYYNLLRQTSIYCFGLLSVTSVYKQVSRAENEAENPVNWSVAGVAENDWAQHGVEAVE